MEIRKLIRCACACVLLLLAGTVQAQTSFYKVYNGNSYDKGEGITQLPDSGFLVTGSSSSFGEAPSQVFLLRIDSLGNYKWSKSYGGPEFEEGKRVMAVPGFGYFIAGTSSSGPSHDFDGYLLFTDEVGNQQWETYFANGGWERIHDAILLPDTSVFFVGETDATSDGHTDVFAGRADKSGNLLWSQQWGSNGDDVAYSVIALTDTTVAIGGEWYVTDSLQKKALVMKVHTGGAVLWQETFGLEGEYCFNDLYLETNVIKAVGQRIKTGKTDHDSYTAQIDLSGNLIIAEEYYMDDDTRYMALTAYSSGNGKYFIGYQSINPNIPTYDIGEDCYISRYSSGLYWDSYGMGYNGVGQDQINDLVATSDGFAVATGFHTQYGTGGNSVFVVKIGNENSFPSSSGTPVIVNLVGLFEPVQLKGLKVYPNPVQDWLHLEVPHTAFSVILSDASGKVQETVQSFEVQQLDFSNRPSGVYFVRIVHAGGESVTVKIVR